ncbi:DNA cytosine methyltransferase [Kribbella sp. NPDC051718]|uniref:DNA cytosine methyltransferase n=1 Tax=Kribbella sp. NPDC051718 TaxID=3155168 RepID=UPI00344ACFB1
MATAGDVPHTGSRRGGASVSREIPAESTAGTRLACVSVFSGAMGLDLGLEAAGFDIRMAADNMDAAARTAGVNRPDLPFFADDARALDAKKIYELSGLGAGEVDLLAGGPPCQSFSTAGRRRGMDDIDRGPLLFEFVRLIDEVRPRAFLLENVKGLLSASTRWRELPHNNNGKIIDDLHGSLFRELSARLKDLGYSIDFRELNSADYGVPQARRRVFVMGYRDGHRVSFPDATHAAGGGLLHQPWRTLGDALSGLEDDRSYCVQFSERKLQYLKMVPAGGNWRDLPEAIQKESMGKAFYAKGGRSGYWRRLSLDAPSPTILTEPQNASTSLCHPIEDRPLSVRECARIQTFPDDWEFAGSGRDQYKLVGNAVPVALAEAVAKHLHASLLAQAQAAAQQIAS